jgi:predicted DNA-binding ribbon-helix-helix protein
VADSRGIRLSRLVNDVASATPERTNLASTLRTFCLIHAQLRWRGLERDLEQLNLAGNTQDLPRVLDACPLPCLLLSADRTVKRLNQAFAAWLHVDGRGVLGQRLDNIMILRGADMPALWQRIFGDGGKGRFNATYVSPGKVRTAQALAVGLSPRPGANALRACLIIFETLAGRG